MRQPSDRGNRIDPSIAVIGAGAVGAFYGSMLQRSGLSVEYLSATMARTERLKVRSPWGSYSLPVRSFAEPADMQPADLIIVSLKVLPDVDPFPMIEPVIKKNSIILLLQNGINQEERYARYFHRRSSKPQILGGLAFTCINRIRADFIDHIDYGLIKIGSPDRAGKKTATALAELFKQAGIQCETVNGLRRARYEKLLWNAAYNTLSVLLLAETDSIVGDSGTADLSLRIMSDIQAIAAAENIRLPGSMVRGMLDRTRRMRPYKTSMLLDYEAGRPMELDIILGEPIRMARQRKVPVPHLQMAYDLLVYLDRQRQARA